MLCESQTVTLEISVLVYNKKLYLKIFNTVRLKSYMYAWVKAVPDAI
jgi:hypothetical protein